MKALPRSSEKGTRGIGRMKMTTIMTITGWVENPSVDRNDLAGTLITVSHFNAHSFLAIITYTLSTFINFLSLFTRCIVYRPIRC